MRHAVATDLLLEGLGASGHALFTRAKPGSRSGASSKASFQLGEKFGAEHV